MSKFSLDYSGLEHKIYKKAYRLSDVKDQIEKVAFDIVRFKDGDKSAELWQVQSADDGDYIVSLYNEDEVEKTAATWEVSVIKTAGEIQISYKGDPLVRLASSKIGIPRAELDKVTQYLPAKLAENKKLVKSLLNELPPSAKKAVLNKYPELV
jgi:hypothetical protein